jgi:hypothetical protein
MAEISPKERYENVSCEGDVIEGKVSVSII